MEGMKGLDKDECAHLGQFGRFVRMGGLPHISLVKRTQGTSLKGIPKKTWLERIQKI
jgi:hypothetical protein